MTLRFWDMAKLTLPLTLTSPFFSETPSHDSSIPLYTQRVQIFIRFFSTTLCFRDMAKLTSPLTLTSPFFSEAPSHFPRYPLHTEGPNFYKVFLYDAPFPRYGKVNLTPNPNPSFFAKLTFQP